MGVVGQQNRDEIELDPARAWQRAKALDAVLKAARLPHPRGVFRATHSEFALMDALRQIEAVRRLNLR